MTHLSTKASAFIENAKTENTLRAYASDWQDFADYCEDTGADILPASAATVANYLAERAETLKPATLSRRLTVIRAVHDENGFRTENPACAAVVRLTLAGIKRTKGTRQTAKAPLTAGDLLRLMKADVFHGLTGLRDRALLLLGFAAALRRSELAGVCAEHLTFTADGVLLLLPCSKSDQVGKGAEIAIPYAAEPRLCPVRALLNWISAAHIERGPVFQAIDLRANLSGKAISPRTVAEIVKRYAERLGYNAGLYSGHSLRRGFATDAAAHGVSLPDIMHQTRHKSEHQAMKYVQAGRRFQDSPLSKLM